MSLYQEVDTRAAFARARFAYFACKISKQVAASCAHGFCLFKGGARFRQETPLCHYYLRSSRDGVAAFYAAFCALLNRILGNEAALVVGTVDLAQLISTLRLVYWCVVTMMASPLLT